MTHDRSAGLVETARALADGTITSRALVEQALARIETTQATLNAFRLRPGRGRARRGRGRRPPTGRRGAAAAARGARRGQGRHRCGRASPPRSAAAASSRPVARDGEAVRRLRAAGAVIVGKTNACELGQWPFTEGPAFGATRNPWNPDHTPGGSSGGSAAAVAAGLVPAALGSDGAGSVRIPAAWTHLVGIKPQRGRISTWPRRRVLPGHHRQRPARPHGRRRGPAARRGRGNHAGDLAPAARRRRARRRPAATRAGCASRSPGSPPFTAMPARLHPEVRGAGRRTRRDARPASATTVEEAEPRVRADRARLHPARHGRDRRAGPPRPRSRACSTAAPGTRPGIGRLLGGARCAWRGAPEAVLHRRIGAIFDLVRRRPHPDHRHPAAADRHHAGAERLAHRPRDDRGLPVRLALERPRLARGQRPRRVHRRRPARRAPSCSARRTASRC